MSTHVQLIYFALAQAALASLLAAAYGLAWQAAGVFHLAMAPLVVLAPFITAAAISFGLPVWAAIGCGLAFAAAVSALIELGVYRPLPPAEKVGALVSSLGVSIILTNLLAIIFGTNVTTLQLLPERMLKLPLGSLSLVQSVEIVCALAVALGVIWSCRRTLGVQAAWLLAEKPVLATALGLPSGALRSSLMAFSGVLAGLAGLFMACDGGITPHSGTSALLTGAVAVMAGGGRSPLGWVAGAFLIAFVQTAVSWWLPGQWSEATGFIVLSAVLWFKPGGLASVVEREAA